MQGRDQGELYRGFGDGLARAFELALTPAIIAGIGYLLDRWLGLLPLFTIVFFLLAVVGMFARMYYAYGASMASQDRSAPWGTGTGTEGGT